MIKLFESLFALCIVMMSEYVHLYEYTFYEHISTAAVKNSNRLVEEKKQHSVSKIVIFNTKEENKQNHTTDIEEKENEVVSFKKYSSFSNNIHPLFYTQQSHYLFQYTEIHSFFFKHFSCLNRICLYVIFYI